MQKNMIDVFFSVIQRLESENILYMVVGAFAAMVYGEPRMTHDVDLVLDLLPKDAGKLKKLFPLKEFYCPPRDVLNTEIIRQGQFNLIDQDTGIKIDIMIRKHTEHAQVEFQRRKKVPFWQGSEVYLASVEDVILKKLSFYREGGSEKHLRDILGMIRESKIDYSYLKHWIQKLDLLIEWEKITHHQCDS